VEFDVTEKSARSITPLVTRRVRTLELPASTVTSTKLLPLGTDILAGSGATRRA
jgi:hypothetical protein